MFLTKGFATSLVHSTNNDLADSSTDSNGPEHNGVSEFGAEVIREMNRLGIMVDVSHAVTMCSLTRRALKGSDHRDALNARAVTDHRRNMTDEMLKLLAEMAADSTDDAV